jgi:hypothetical protein
MYFVNRTPREDECSPGLRSEVKALSSGDDFVLDGPTQYHVQEIVDVFVVWNHTCRNAVILEGDPAPLNRRAAKSRTCTQERFDATRAENLDPRSDGAIAWCPGRHIDASKLNTGRSASHYLSAILNEFPTICTVSVF